MKSANTFIAEGGEVFVVADGFQSLAKGGSGDILAGLTASRLAQGYTSKEAAITAAEHHALLSQKSKSPLARRADLWYITCDLFTQKRSIKVTT